METATNTWGCWPSPCFFFLFLFCLVIAIALSTSSTPSPDNSGGVDHQIRIFAQLKMSRHRRCYCSKW
uniref:Putative secreted protein n=1 Tax=Anopheles darlingi TaxID=43151 RepID=A0A2M4DMG1_ANODA